MRAYLDLLQHILDHGVDKPDRTGTGTRSVFGHQMRFALNPDDATPQAPAGFPLVTTKKLHLKSIIVELLWFLRGDTNVAYLHEHGVSIWDEWADENGELGPVYGKQWRSFPTPDGQHVDQIAQLIESLRTSPHSRRHLVCAWNPGEIEKMALPPCHALFQFYVTPPPETPPELPPELPPEDAPPQRPVAAQAATGSGSSGSPSDPQAPDLRPALSCQLYQRSADVFLGVPFNIASYALLTCMLAQVLGYKPGEFVHTLGDAHLYTNHVDQARLQLTREPRALPTLQLNPAVSDLFAFTPSDIAIQGYDPHPHIKAAVAV